MEKLRFEFDCKIIRIFNDGFNAVLEDNYLIKFKDIKIKHPFLIDDKLIIAIENIENKEIEEITSTSLKICGIISSFINNGFLFNSEISTFFWNSRGMLTHKLFERDNFFKKNSFIKINMRKY